MSISTFNLKSLGVLNPDDILTPNPYMTRKQIASDLLSSHIWVGPSHDYRCASATIVMTGLSKMDENELNESTSKHRSCQCIDA